MNVETSGCSILSARVDIFRQQTCCRCQGEASIILLHQVRDSHHPSTLVGAADSDPAHPTRLASPFTPALLVMKNEKGTSGRNISALQDYKRHDKS